MRKAKKMIALLLAVLVGTACVMACTTDKPAANGNDETVTIALATEIGSFDPIIKNDTISASIYGCIYETLTMIDANDQAVPGPIVESIEQPDELTYVFHLKKGIKFTNGEELKAEDVIFSLARGCEGALSYLTGDIDPASFEATDDYTVKLKTRQKSGTFLANLSVPMVGILSKKAVESAGDSYGMSAIGTGPYVFKKWDQGVEVVLERNENYHGKLPEVKTLVFRPIVEATNRTIELETGGVDIAVSIGATDIYRIEAAENLRIETFTARSLMYFGFCTNVQPFDNKLVRQALAYCIDTAGITNNVKMGYATLATTPVSTVLPFHNNDIPVNPYDLTKAKELLAEAGYPDGFKTTIYTRDASEHQAVVTIVKEAFSQIGVDADIQVVEYATYLDMLFAGECGMYTMGWSNVTPYPDFILNTCFHSKNIGPAGNCSYVNDPEIDKALDDANASLDQNERRDLLYGVQANIFDNRYWVPIWYNNEAVGVNNRIKTVALDSSAIHHWYDITLNKP